MKQLRWPRSLVGPGLSALSALSILTATVGCGRTKAETATTAEIAVDALAAAPATIARAHGAVWLLTSEGERQAVSGGALGEGEVLATGPGGGAVVVLGPGREVELKPNGRLKLRRQDGQLVVEVDGGNIVSRTPGTQEVALTILTPFGITRVPAGTEARFGIAANRVRIDVALGQLEFTDAMGQAVIAHASESIEVKLGDVQLLQGPDGEAPGKPLELLLSAESGTLFVRRPGEQGFTPQRGGTGPAPAGTQYRIDAPDARARLLAPGLRVQLERRASGHIGEASRSAQGRRFALALDRGTATFALPAGEAQELVLADQANSAPISLRATEATTVMVTAEAGGTSITVLAGAADLAVGESRQRLETGARASVSGERVTVGKRAPSDVVLPTARGQRVYADLLGDVTLTWPAAAAAVPTGKPGASPGWFVEVARDPGFKDIVLAGRVAGNAVTLPAPSRTDLHWRVNQGEGAGQEPLQGSVRFVPDSALSVLRSRSPAQSGQRRQPGDQRALSRRAARVDLRVRGPPGRRPLPPAAVPGRGTRAAAGRTRGRRDPLCDCPWIACRRQLSVARGATGRQGGRAVGWTHEQARTGLRQRPHPPGHR